LAFALEGSAPETGHVAWETSRPIELTFSQTVSPLELEQHVRIVPSTAFKVQSIDPDSMAFRLEPDTGWMPLTAYRLELDEGITSDSGEPIQGGAEISFSTAADWLAPSQVAWSGDSRLAAFVAPGQTGDDAYELYVVEPAKSLTPRPVYGGLSRRRPVFSRDGQKIMINSPNKDGTVDLWSISLDGTPELILTGSEYGFPGSIGAYPNPETDDLLLEVNSGGVDAHSDILQQLYIMSPGQKPRPLEDGATESVTMYALGWISKDEVLYLATHDNRNHSHSYQYEIKVFDQADGSSRLAAGEDNLVNNFGEVCRDSGGGAYFTTWSLFNSETWMEHRPDTLWQLAPGQRIPAKVWDERYVQYLSAASDGSRLVFLSNRGGIPAVVSRELPGGQERIFPVDGVPYAPSLSPDGNRLAVWVNSKDGLQLNMINPANGVVVGVVKP
jgi:dipeptidyl aminopeptidase/acylaminoacyl peptidase